MTAFDAPRLTTASHDLTITGAERSTDRHHGEGGLSLPPLALTSRQRLRHSMEG